MLNRSVSPPMLGHAFSAHSLGGNLGWAAAPVFMTSIAAVAGWRAAAFAAAVLPAIALALLVSLRANLAPRSSGAERASAEPSLAFLRTGAVWMCFFFFLASTTAFGALQNFAPSVLKNVYGLPLTAGASALTGYLLGGALGISIGGFLAARYQAHERVIAALLVGAALFALALATAGVPQWAVVPLMAAVGFCTGTASPSRDLLVRKAAMERFGQRSFGRVYGFVYSGLDAGLSIAPILFGRLMDAGMFTAVLFGVAVFQGLSVLAALAAGQTRVPAAQPSIARP
jgi:MFS transporter, FSR family, fosmidomycin resistance protein